MSSEPSWNCLRTESCERRTATGSMPRCDIWSKPSPLLIYSVLYVQYSLSLCANRVCPVSGRRLSDGCRAEKVAGSISCYCSDPKMIDRSRRPIRRPTDCLSVGRTHHVALKLSVPVCLKRDRLWSVYSHRLAGRSTSTWSLGWFAVKTTLCCGERCMSIKVLRRPIANTAAVLWSLIHWFTRFRQQGPREHENVTERNRKDREDGQSIKASCCVICCMWVFLTL